MIRRESMTQQLTGGAIAAILTTTLATAVVLATAQMPGMSHQVTTQKAAATITLTTKPSPPVSGENEFVVSVTNADGAPVIGADVSVMLVMPAMPMMSMPEMKSGVSLKPAEGTDAKPGTYTGRGEVPMPGRWNVTVSIKVNGEVFAEKKLTLSAK